MAEESFGLFGYPTPEEVRQAIGKANTEEDFRLANNDPSGAIARQFGRLVSGGIGKLFGKEEMDPRIVKAQRMELAKKRVQDAVRSNGIDFTKEPVKYMDTTAKVLADMGEHDLAWKAIDQRNAYLSSQAEAGKLTAEGRRADAQAEAEKTKAEAYAKKVMNEGSYQEKKLLLESIKANAYANAVKQQGKGGSNAKSALLVRLLEKKLALPEGQTLSPAEEEVIDTLSKPFMPNIEQIIASQLGQGSGTGDPGNTTVQEPPINSDVIDLDEYDPYAQ